MDRHESSPNFDSFKKSISGDFFDDEFTRGRYATDASIYQMIPHAVVIPKTVEDIKSSISFCNENNIALLPRGGGTSQNGQAINRALVLDNTKYLNKVIDLDVANQTCIVEPGIVLDELNHHLKPHGLWFPIDVSTSSRATIGGMAGNNSCGGRSIKYGMTRDNVITIEAIMADGSVSQFGHYKKNQILPAGQLGKILPRLLQVGNDNKELINKRFPKVLRRVGGYNIDALVPDAMANRPGGKVGDGQNLAHLIVGSEGTLAYSHTLTLKLSPLPALKVMGLCHFPSFYSAMEAAQHIVKLKPVAVELIDNTMLELASSISMFQPTVEAYVRGKPAALLVVEFAEDNQEENEDRLTSLQDLIANLGFSWSNANTKKGGVVSLKKDEDQTRITEMRKSGLNIMMSMKTEAKPVSFVEDCAVPLPNLAEYTDKLTKIFEKYNTTGTWYAHASVGCLHVRPILNMKNSNDVFAMRKIAEEAFELVRQYKGSHSGEHGDGISRSEFSEKMFGHKMVSLFQLIKHEFDPQNLFNPGKITNAPKMDDRSLFRYAPGYHVDDFPTKLNWKNWPGSAGGLQGAVEMCNNNGACRKLQGGVMCPSFRATRNERDSTRGRANSLRLALSGQLGPKALASDEMSESLKLCVSCKACKRECPTGVDMTRMKIEVGALRAESKGLSFHEKLVAHMPVFAPYAALISPLLELREKLPGLALLIEKLTDFSAQRPLPRFHQDWIRPKEIETSPTGTGKPVILFIDTFNRFFEPENVRAAARVLKAAGYDVFAPLPNDKGRPLCCGRTFLSTGLIKKASIEASRLVDTLLPFVRNNIPIVGLEPSCTLALRDEVLALISNDAAEKIAKATMTFEELLARDKPNLPLKMSTKTALLHGHCHQKAFGVVKPIEEVLSWIRGLKIQTIDSSCCGMAGAFGYNKETYKVSIAMANAGLLPEIKSSSPDNLIIADGISCRCQIKDNTSRNPQHAAVTLDNHLDHAMLSNSGFR